MRWQHLSSRGMQAQTPNWDLELADNAGSCWDKRWKDGLDKIYSPKDHYVSLRPPRLFRSIGGLTGTSASLPPHRRLRSIFCRSRAILPANMEKQALGVMQTTLDVITPGKTLTETNRLTKAGETTHTLTLAAVEPQKGMFTQSDSSAGRPKLTGAADNLTEPHPSLQLAPPAWIHSEGRAVSPLAHKADHRRSKRGSKTEAAQRKQRKKKNGVEAIYLDVEGPKDGGLSQWLQSLEIVDRERNTPLGRGDGSQRGRTQAVSKPGMGRRKGVLQRTTHFDTELGHRKDRRPHFLPPITQSGSLLGVPLLLPENSPPPSPCFSSNTPFAPLLVPQLHLASPKKNTNIDPIPSTRDSFP
ncbi:hypothetical protein GN956_G2825 [Arapaima gigas]